MPLEITKDEAEGGVTVLELSGELDTTTAPILEEQVRAVASGPEPALVLDLSGVTFVSSFGLRVIVMASKLMRVHGDRFALHSPQDDVQGILKLAGFTRFMKIADDREGAVALVRDA